MLHKKIVSAAFCCGALLLAGPAFAQSTSNQALLDLLIKKGILTQQEADSLQQEANAPAPTTTTTTTTTVGTATPTVPLIAGPGTKSPLAFQIGSAAFTPFGFLDFTSVFRSTNTGGSIGSGFSSIPFNNTAAGQLSETRFSTQNSRLGLRVDSTVAGDTKALGYVETDFLGAGPTNQNVTSNSDALRMRVYFIDLMKGNWEFLAGQDWSMMTPNRKGLSPIPSDIFFTQNVDTNYQNGLIWARQPQIRAVYHADSNWTMGVSLENPDQYTGSAVTLPTGFNAASVDNGSNGTATPDVIPDVIAKLAYDTKVGDLPFHAEVAGLYSEFKINTLTTGANAVNANDTAAGGAASFNMDLAVAPGFHLIENAFDGDGGGRYIANGNAPDFIVRPANASGIDTISPVHAWSALGGFEWDTDPTNKFYGYYSDVHIAKDYVQTGATTYVGYGNPGSANTNNKSIEEFTLGDAFIFWKNPAYGDLKFLVQASYVDRKPWVVLPGAPQNAHLGMFYLDLRYDLP